ncbi:MAG: hypothetical protein KKH94_11090, partial [Candidatus Omnitrophica bacterium]|nr:hypothetical protein [Candidatus Omnitrophota bacterium]
MIKNCIYETWHNLYSKVHLRRCTKCILPATMPFINFNEQGVCNYCTSHKKVIARGHEELKKIILPYRSNNGADDCIVAFTGGRDSSYSLHYVKTVLKMHPVAFTYDCGMATEIAQRNRKRMCDALGVKQIIVAVDGTIKRKNIKKNINAWLRRPDLGMIPLFMAGDKQIIHYARKVKKKTGIPLIFYGLGNRHEDALFKLGFSQVYTESPMLYYNISLLNKVKFAAYYAKQYLANPRYINHSLFDALYGYFCLFFLGKQNGDMFL